MTESVPPEPSAEDAPAPVKNPWALPDPTAAPGPAPTGVHWPQYTPPAPEPRNGLGVTALVLGIVAVLLSLPLGLFWVTWLPALLAVLFGCIGLSLARRNLATNRGIALAGTVLGGIGLLASLSTGALAITTAASDIRAHDRTVKQHQQEDAEQRRRTNEEWQKYADEQAAKAADERARRLSFGGSYTYPDGLKVTMAPPTAVTPVRTPGSTLPEDATFVQIQVTVVNTGSAELSLYGSGLLIVKDSGGTPLHPTFDAGRYTSLPKSLAPGEEATGLETYGLPNASADRFTVQFTHGTRLDRKDVIWSGAPPH
ncbi:hypothetical protein [Kitasatospora sp. NPDC004531]